MEDFFGFWFRNVEKDTDKLPQMVVPPIVVQRMDARIKRMKVAREYTRKPNALRYDTDSRPDPIDHRGYLRLTVDQTALESQMSGLHAGTDRNGHVSSG